MISTPTLPTLLEQWQQTLNWQPDSLQQKQFQGLYELILQGNQKFNLTRITEPTEFWEKHLWDSLRGMLPIWQTTTGKAIDIGTGAGFPGVPIAIVFPQLQVTMLDSTRKKITFIESLFPDLDLQNTQTLVGRVEEIGQDLHHRQVYDLAFIRAVSTAAVCAEYALPLLKVGGTAILYRGQWTEEENTQLETAVKKLGGKIQAVDQFETPISQGSRHCIYLKKMAPTSPQYPRAVGIPHQRPLGSDE